MFFIKKKRSLLPKIALIFPHGAPTIQKVQNNFLSTLAKTRICYEFIACDTESNLKIATHLIKKIAKSNDVYLLFSLGKMCTQIAHQVTRRYHSQFPIIFSAIIKSTAQALIEHNSPQPITGLAVESSDYTKHLDALRLLKPTLRTATFIYHQDNPYTYQYSTDFMCSTYYYLTIRRNTKQS